MAVFNGMTITSAGENMLAQAIDGQGTLIFTSMSTSTQQISGNLDSIVALTDIKQTVTPTSAVINNNAIQVTGDFTNVSVQQQYDVNTIGLYAKLGNGTEMLFAVASASTPDTIPAQSTPFTFSYVFNVAVSNTAQIVVNIEGGGTSNYNDLFNKPQLNGVDLIGNKTLDDVGAVAKNQGTGNAGKVLGIGENGIVTPMESGGGIPGQDGEDGGYYTPTVTQPTDETMQMSFAASKPSMPPVQPVTINLPSGGDALNGLPSGGTAGQVLSKKTNTDYDAEWTDAPVGGDTYFELVNNNTSVTNGVSLDISGLLANAPSYGGWDDLQNWYRISYRGDSIPALNGFPAEKIISKPIQGIPYFRAFTDQSNQYSLNNTVGFYGSDSDKAITEEGHEVKACSKTYVYIPVDNLPDDTQGAGVIIVYPTESYDYYYIKLNDAFFANNNTGKYNRTNPTYIAAFDSGVLENPLMSIAEYNEQYLKMKDEYLDGYYKNMFAYEPFVTIFKNYFAQMAPKVGIPQTFGKAIYIGGDSLHAYAGGDGKSTDGFVTNWNQYLGFSVVTNAGYAGSTWSELTGGGGLKRAKDLISAGTVYDVIILAWGTNDDTGGNGTIDDVASDAEGATMVAAMKWIITNLRNTFKNTSIGVIIPPPKNTEDGMKTKGDLMIQVCELLHVPFVDMRQYVSISDLGGDTVHLGTGAGKYGAAEASLIMRICQYGDTLYPGNSEST